MSNYNDIEDLRNARDRSIPKQNTDLPIQEAPTIDNNIIIENNEPDENNEIVVDIGSEDLAQNRTLGKTNEILSEIQTKFESFKDMLSAKLISASPELTEVRSTANALIDEAPKVEKEPVKDLLPPIKSDTQKTGVAGKPKELTERVSDASGKLKGVAGVGKLIDVTKKGQAAVMGLGNKVTSMLFKMSITAGIAAAKTAAAILAIIVAIDLIRIYFKEFTKWFSAKWDAFMVSWENYFKDFGVLGEIFDNISTGIGKIRNSIDGGLVELGKTIVSVMYDYVKQVAATINLAITRGFASVLKSMGFKDKAKALEAEAIQTYADNAHTNLSPEDEKKLAEKKSNDIEKGMSTWDKVKLLLPANLIKSALTDTDTDNFKVKSAMGDDNTHLKTLSKDDREGALIAVERAKKAAWQYQEHAAATNVSDSSDVSRLEKSYVEVQKLLDDPRLKDSPNAKAAISKQLENAKQSVESRKPKAATSSESTEAKSVSKIEQAKAANVNSKSTNNTTANVNNTKVVSNKSHISQAPITGYKAPGIFGATAVN